MQAPDMPAPDMPIEGAPEAADRHTVVGRIMASRPAVAVLATLPVPLSLVQWALRRDNARENAKDSWNRLRRPSEAARYTAVRALTEAYAADGFVLDVGCSQGILAEGLRYRRYLGVDSFPAAVGRAAVRSDERTAFVCADGSAFVPDERPDAVVLNEVLYYLRDPVGVAEHYAGLLRSGGALIVSVYARSWASRRLLRRLARRLEPVAATTAVHHHLAWSVTAYRPRPS